MVDDNCYTATGAGFMPTSAATTFQAACLAKLAACPRDAFGDDACFRSDIYTDALNVEFTTCLDSACGTVDACFLGVLNAHAPGCGG